MEIAVESPEILEVPAVKEAFSVTEEIKINTIEVSNHQITETKIAIETTTTPTSKEVDITISSEPKVSALSLSSIRAKKELEKNSRSQVKEVAQLPTEPFSETDMLLQWNKYAQRLSDKGHKIMESLLLINDPKLDGTTITHELPNQGSKIDFEGEKYDLLGYLRGKLHNHDITIEIVVNEKMDSRKAFTPQDKFNRLNEINPSLDLLRRTFDLDI